MGKRKKQDSTCPTSLSMEGKDTFKRMNFLYQAAHLYSTPLLAPISCLPKYKCTSSLLKLRGHVAPLSRYLCSEFMLTARKHTLRIDPDVKHTICPQCHSFLQSPFTCQIEFKYPVKTKRRKQHPEKFQHLPITQFITCSFCHCQQKVLASSTKVPFHIRAQVPTQTTSSVSNEKEKEEEPQS